MSDDKELLIGFCVAMLVIFGTISWSVGNYYYTAREMAKNGYCEVTVIGTQSLAWQKCK